MGNVKNLQIEEQRNKNDELVLDEHQRPKRAYILLGNSRVEINEKLITSLSVLMKPNAENGKKIQVLSMLPFWTTTYYFYLTNKNDSSYVEAEIELPKENKSIEQVNSKLSGDGKVNSIRNNLGGRGGRVKIWGDRDELLLSTVRDVRPSKSDIVMS